jgi:uncharacterized protein YyaL (SSP411 family)
MPPIRKFNRLGQEKSPYLLQHKDNPVHWFAWGKDAFAAARAENKPIFLSIGYSTCYWCHMMEKDSFELPEVADVMNKYFINVKVDREEHPDVDQIYMDAVMAMTGRGGWPMSAFLTPDLQPFFAGTFFWRAQFLDLMERVHAEWTKNPDNVRRFGEEVAQAIRARTERFATAPYDDGVFREAFHELRGRFDPAYGGFGPAPKFPHAGDAMLLLRIFRRGGSEEALRMALKSLSEMAGGGLYDHVGGGFHRYSTDERWFAPHFEKMLYDNALLAQAFIEAWQVTRDERFAAVARGTLDYVIRDMTAPNGGFTAAEDAGEVDHEGDFYVWTFSELKTALTAEEFEAAERVFKITERGNWEHGKNILHLGVNAASDAKTDPLIQSAAQKLFALRAKRPRPHRDDKVLTSWNGLMIAALSKGFQALGDKRYLSAAQNVARFIRECLDRDGNLLRRYCDGDARYAATLDDHAFLIDGLIHLYESDFDADWLTWAKGLQTRQDQAFWDEENGGYFYTPAIEQNLIARRKEFHDGALPCGNAVSLLNLLRLADLTGEAPFREKAERLAGLYAEIIRVRSSTSHAHALMALDYALDRSKEIALAGTPKDAATNEFLARLRTEFVPNKIIGLAGGTAEPVPEFARGKPVVDGRLTIHVCEHGTCLKPETDVEKALAVIGECRKYAM